MIGRLHHIGIASWNIQADMSFYGLLGYAAKGALREDVHAGIRVQFMSAEGQPDIELVQNLAKGGPMTPHLQARRKVFHFAYPPFLSNGIREARRCRGGGVFSLIR